MNGWVQRLGAPMQLATPISGMQFVFLSEPPAIAPTAREALPLLPAQA